MRPFVALLALVLFAGATVWANGPPNQRRPDPQPGSVGKVEIRVDEKADQARLLIPRRFVFERRADAGNGFDDKSLGAARPSPLHLAVAGLALSLALTFGGLWLVRSRVHLRARNVALLLTTCTLLALGGVLLANGPPPGSRVGGTGNNTGNNTGGFGGLGGGQGGAIPPQVVALPPGILASDKVVVEVIEKGDAVVLVISPAMKAKLAEKPAKEESKTRK